MIVVEVSGGQSVAPAHASLEAPIQTHLHPPSYDNTFFYTLAITSSQLNTTRTMDEAAKIGERIMWDYQLKRQLFDFSQRLKTVDAQLAKQQNHHSSNEKSTLAEHEERLDAVEKRIRALEDGDTTERIAGLAGELRDTRQDVKKLRDKESLLEETNKAIESKAKEGNEAVSGSFEELGGKLRMIERGFETHLQHATERVSRLASEALRESSGRHDGHTKALSEQLLRLEREQTALRTLVENMRDSLHEFPAVPSTIAQTTTAPTTTAPAAIVPSAPETVSKRATKPSTAAAPPPSEPKQKRPPVKKEKANGLSREVAQLIYGDGSLTNAPAIMESQHLTVPTSRGGNKRKLDAEEEASTHFAFAQRETRSQVKRIKEDPNASKLSAGAKPVEATKTATSRRAPKQALQATKISKASSKVTKATTQKRRKALASSDEIEVARSWESPVLRPSLDQTAPERSENRPSSRRRRIQQDDTEEEFLAKCLAIKAEAE